jgi:protein-disulfide isomerase
VSRTEEETGTTTGPPEGVAEVTALYRGIPQRGVQLGKSDAPVGIIEFADLQCPFCGEYSRDVMPAVVERYVRPGKVKVAFRGLAFIGDDSEEALRVAYAASLQNKLFQFVDLVYRNQGAENSGWVDDDYLQRIGRAAGLDVPAAFGERGGVTVSGAVDGAKAEAKEVGLEGTPMLLIFRKGSSEPVRMEADELSVGNVTEELDKALAN